ncbi:MAG TPA: DNA polymerase III subunit delta [Acidimicrobiales bacterium]|nr:DNA polymerase III subunit delta [Acidimicrobiales bacterium]
MSEAVAVYLVRGDDPSLVSQSLSEVIDSLLPEEERALALEDLSSDEPDVGAVIDACLTPPFLASRRVVVVREIGRLRAEEVNRLVAYIGQPADTTSLVMGATGAVPARMVEAVRKVGHVVDASVPSGRGRSQWLTNRLRRAPVHLDARAANALGEHLGEDLGRLEGILDVLAAAYGQGARVGLEELEDFLGTAGGVAPWELTDAIDAGNVAAALSALARLTGAGQRHPLVVLATLHRHYAAMLRLDGAGVTSDAEAARLLGMKSNFPAGKARAQGARLGRAGIGRAFELLGAADLDLRGATGVGEQTVLEVLVARLARLGGGAGRRRVRTRR